MKRTTMQSCFNTKNIKFVKTIQFCLPKTLCPILTETVKTIFPHFLEETEFNLNKNELLSECCLNRDLIMT